MLYLIANDAAFSSNEAAVLKVVSTATTGCEVRYNCATFLWIYQISQKLSECIYFITINSLNY